MPGVFQPLSSSPITPPSLASVLLQHRTLCLQRKKHTLSHPTSALSRTPMSELLHMDSLAWRIAWGAPHPITTPLPPEGIQYIKTIRFTHTVCCPFVKPVCHTKEKSGLISSFLKRKCRAGLCVGCSYYPVFLVIKQQTQRAACSTRQLGLCAISAALELS